jgi:head-tail adaptor
MSFAGLLINTCTIRRYAAGAADAYGNPTKDWADHLVNEPCRWSTPVNREIKVGAEIVIADLQLFLEADTDITEQDRVILNATTYEVLSAADRQNGTGNHHVECLLRTVR